MHTTAYALGDKGKDYLIKNFYGLFFVFCLSKNLVPAVEGRILKKQERSRLVGKICHSCYHEEALPERICNSHYSNGVPKCLTLSVVQLKGKHCQKTHFRNRIVDTFEHCLASLVCSQLLLRPQSKTKQNKEYANPCQLFFVAFVPRQVTQRHVSAFSQKINNLDFDYKLMKTCLVLITPCF